MAFDMSKAAFGKASVSNLDRVKRIALDDIDINEKNFYSLDKIEELAASIQMVGLLEPVRVVRRGPDEIFPYQLISGHRRTAAYEYLHDTTGDDKYAEIPALVMEDLDDLSETFALITANSTARELSYAEKLKQEQLLRETLTAMKEAGKPVPKNLGQYIADQIGTSRNEVSRMHSINENLIPEAREQVDKGEMTAQQAYELSRKPEQEQRETVSAGKRQPAGIDQEEISRKVAAMKAAVHLLDGLLSRVGIVNHIVDRSTGIMELKAGLKRRGSFGDQVAWITAQDVTLAVTLHDDKMRYVTPSELWDAMSIAAMRRCAELSKLDTEEDKPSPAGTRSARVPADAGALTHGMWHTPEDPPKEDGSYVCMYRGAGDDGATRRTTVMQYKSGAWQLYGNSVEDVYTVLKWTEVPEC